MNHQMIMPNNFKAICLAITSLFFFIAVNGKIQTDSLQKTPDSVIIKTTDTSNTIPFVVVPDTSAKAPEKVDTIKAELVPTPVPATPQQEKKPSVVAPEPAIEPAVPQQETKQINNPPTSVVASPVQLDTVRLDTIIKKSGGRMKVKIEGKNLFEILFKYPGQKITKKMSTSSIKEIRYANGKIEIIDTSPEKRPKDWVPVVAEVEYSKIEIAKDASNVANLVEMGEVEAYYMSRKMMAENSFLEKNALIILRKKAVTLKATTILVTYKDIVRQYGEFPSIAMKATAYGTGNPPEE
jgi:hypothetical protein